MYNNQFSHSDTHYLNYKARFWESKDGLSYGISTFDIDKKLQPQSISAVQINIRFPPMVNVTIALQYMGLKADEKATVSYTKNRSVPTNIYPIMENDDRMLTMPIPLRHLNYHFMNCSKQPSTSGR
ncbi:MAG: hypothetical protein ABI378_00185 [Chitinophagaceae bacterium]